MAKKKSKNKNKAITFAHDALKAEPLYLAIFLIWGIYVYLTFQAPDTGARTLGISAQQLDRIRVTVAIPYLLIWLSAMYSFIKIKRYALAIAPSRESGAFSAIANGIFILVVSLVTSTLLSAVRSMVVGDQELRQFLTILTNYAYVFPYLLSFGLLFYGVRELSRQVSGIRISVATYLAWGALFIAFAYTWLELIFTNSNRLVDASQTITATYYIKDSLLILSIVIPSLIMWALGVSALIRLRSYYEKVRGVIFKRALSSVVYGFYGIILGSAFLQALLSLGTRRLLDLGLERLLGAVYLLLIIQALGFIFIALGANKLTEIEKA